MISHYPVYYSENTTAKELKIYNILQRFEQLFIRYKVDLYLNAHIHQYERFTPVQNK